MSAAFNLIIILVLLILITIFLVIKLTQRKDVEKRVKQDKNYDIEEFSIPKIVEFVKNSLNEISNSNLHDLGLSEQEYLRRKRKRTELEDALKSCNTGNVNDKLYVKEFIGDLLIQSYNINEETINIPIPFLDKSKLTLQDKFDILLHLYKKKYDTKALSKLIETYNLDRLKPVENADSEGYYITKKEIENIFQKEYNKSLNFDDKLQIMVQRVYSNYKGFGVIDEIRDQVIDGISGGVSGLPETIQSIEEEVEALNTLQTAPRTVDSVWIMYKGKTIHLSFLSFGTLSELRRVTQNIYKFNNPGQLSESRPYIVNEMADGSRVVVVRPNFSESWAFFIRKFDLPNASLESIVQDENSEIVINLLRFLMAGARVTGITGQQGSGKTTLLMALIKYISPTHNLRIQELAFELHLRKIYSGRNILSFRETEYVSGQEGLDLQKKTDGSVNILGEVASHEVATWMIQMAQVASEFTVFTHHAKTFKKLIEALRNSLLKTGMFSDEKIAEEQVVNVINFDVHLIKDSSGHRYIERITECIPLNDEVDYPMEWKDKETKEEKLDAMMETMTEYFRRRTDRKAYQYRNIIEYRDGKYVSVCKISDNQITEMMERMTPKQAEEFAEFTRKNWG